MSTAEWHQRQEDKKRLAMMKIKKLISQIPTIDKLDLDYEDDWERGRLIGEARLAEKIRDILEG